MITFFIIMFLLALFPISAHAYLDPGSSNYLIQMSIAIMTMGTALLKTFWYKIKAFLVRRSIIKSRIEHEQSN